MNNIIRPVLTGCSQKEKQTLLFAAQELQKYFSYVSEDVFTVIPAKECDESKHALFLGIKLSTLQEVENPEFDDAICINVKNNAGIITGTNARSVLIGAYRYLKELGFSFLHPGASGEYYPDELHFKEVTVCEKASYRHRAICIEGSVFQSCLNDTIDWLPKAGMNSYFIQFMIPRPFFKRWYEDAAWYPDVPNRREALLSDDDFNEMVALAEVEIEKRGLMYHTVGHGWTSYAFNMFSTDWSGGHPEPDPEYRDVLPLINGERKLFEGKPLNTNFCFSNSVARNRVTDAALEYCKTHKHVTHLAFTLSDGTNNHCECEKCRELLPSDWYVILMNELDQKLTEAGIDTKIVFGVYVDTFWSPTRETLKNKDRFILEFAPIYRSYSSSFDSNQSGTLLPFRLNQLEFPVLVEDNLAYLKEWQKNFDGDGILCDYHFMWDHYCDFPQYRHAQILNEDIKALEKMGLNGMYHLKVQRTSLPTSLGINVMADTMWNKEADFEEIAKKVLSTEFGKDYKLVQEALSKLSEYGCAKAFRNEESLTEPHCRTNLEKAFVVLDQLDDTIAANKNADNQKNASAWEKMDFFAKLYRKILKLAYRTAKGETPGDVTHIRDFVLQHELQWKDEFDAFYFLMTFNNTNRIMKALQNIQDTQSDDRGGEN